MHSRVEYHHKHQEVTILKRYLSIILVVAAVMSLLLTACGPGNTEATPTPSQAASNVPESSPTPEPKKYAGERVAMTANIVGLKGPTSMGMVKVFNELEPAS